MRETRQSGSEGGEGNLPDPYTRGVEQRAGGESIIWTVGITRRQRPYPIRELCRADNRPDEQYVCISWM